MGGCLFEIIRGLIVILMTIAIVVILGLLAIGLYACGVSVFLTVVIVLGVIAFLCYLFFASLIHLI